MSITGTSGDDVLIGTSGQDAIYGFGGNDTIYGLDGLDTLNGGEGDDTLDGGGWFDYADYSTATSGVTVDLRIVGPQFVGGGQGWDSLISIEGVIGSNYDDTLIGSDANGIDLNGGGGNDVLDLRYAHYTSGFLEGRDGNDTLYGGSGLTTTIMEGDNGNDVIIAMGAGELIGDDGNDFLGGGDYNDQLFGGS